VNPYLTLSDSEKPRFLNRPLNHIWLGLT